MSKKTKEKFVNKKYRKKDIKKYYYMYHSYLSNHIDDFDKDTKKLFKYLSVLMEKTVPMTVYDSVIYEEHRSDGIYYDIYNKCPNCHTPQEYEFISYCAYCGQRLDWKLIVDDEDEE